MKIVLLEDVSKLGNAGDVVVVKPGFGRNFLIPTGQAILADPRNIKMLEAQRRTAAAKAEKLMSTHRTFAQRLAKVEIIAKVQTGEGDRMFGAVTTADISSLLSSQGIELDRRLILLDEPIKALGIYTIPVKLHAEVEAIIRVKVVRVETKAEKAEAAEAKAAEAAPAEAMAAESPATEPVTEAEAEPHAEAEAEPEAEAEKTEVAG